MGLVYETCEVCGAPRSCPDSITYGCTLGSHPTHEHFVCRPCADMLGRRGACPSKMDDAARAFVVLGRGAP